MYEFRGKFTITEGGCWTWIRHINKNGYGVLRLEGPIDPDLTVDHLCFNPACVNPEHPFTETNTYYRTGSGNRQCRACNREAVARYKARKVKAA